MIFWCFLHLLYCVLLSRQGNIAIFFLGKGVLLSYFFRQGKIDIVLLGKGVLLSYLLASIAILFLKKRVLLILFLGKGEKKQILM